MTQTPVSSKQRFTRNNPCPICGGHPGLKSGRGERCAGYISDDGEYVFCTRPEAQYAGNLENEKDTTPPTFCHKLYGACNCGKEHNPGRSNGHKPQEKKTEKASSDFFSYDDPRATARYPYYDEQGALLYVAVRYEWDDKDNPKGHSKTIRQFHKGNGKWVPGIANIRRVPYRLPDLLKADPAQTVYIVEGENKVEAMRKLGLVATSNPMGAKKWQKEYSAFLKGRQVVILPDNDNDGREHVQQVASSLQGIAASVRVVPLPNLPEKGDVIDWLASGGTREQLEAMCKPPTRRFTYASEVEEESIEWIWQSRIAKGNFALAVGDAGVGKGLTISAMIANVTRGKWGAPGGVILMSPEDSESQTIVPRLKAAGAQCSKVLLLNEVDEIDFKTGETYKRPVSFPEDAHILREAIEDAGAVLVVIDPVLQLLSGKVDAHKNHAVRQAMAQVLSTARKHDCAVLGVVHTTKTIHPNVLFRSSSSSAFIEMARTALFFVPDPDGDPGQSGVIVNYKNNLARHAESVRYAIHENEKGIGYITWEGISTYTRDELLNQATPTNNKKSEQEDAIVKVLRANGEAMSLEEIWPKTDQTLGALKMMLSRKAEEGLIMRVARGKYTFVGNVLYADNGVTSVTSVTDVTNVTNVTFSENTKESNMNNVHVTNESGSKPTLEAGSEQSNISNITFSGSEQEITLLSPSNTVESPVEPNHNGHSPQVTRLHDCPYEIKIDSDAAPLIVEKFKHRRRVVTCDGDGWVVRIGKDTLRVWLDGKLSSQDFKVYQAVPVKGE